MIFRTAILNIGATYIRPLTPPNEPSGNVDDRDARTTQLRKNLDASGHLPESGCAS